MGIKRRRRKSHPIRIVERKLGHERAMGQAWKGIGLIEIDPRQSSHSYLNTLIHEGLHMCFPDMSESKVSKTAYRLSSLVWRQNFRRIKK